MLSLFALLSTYIPICFNFLVYFLSIQVLDSTQGPTSFLETSDHLLIIFSRHEEKTTCTCFFHSCNMLNNYHEFSCIWPCLVFHDAYPVTITELNLLLRYPTILMLAYMAFFLPSLPPLLPSPFPPSLSLSLSISASLFPHLSLCLSLSPFYLSLSFSFCDLYPPSHYLSLAFYLFWMLMYIMHTDIPPQRAGKFCLFVYSCWFALSLNHSHIFLF